MIPPADLTSARVLADSISSEGKRLTTVQVTMPRFILAEINTHRALSRSSASSRAIPVKRQLENVTHVPFIPQKFPVNQPGMSAAAYITLENDPEKYEQCTDDWLRARDAAVEMCHSLSEMRGVHKQIAARLVEPFMWHTVIASATWEQSDWPNFFSLRISPFAQPEMEKTAQVIHDACEASVPRECRGFYQRQVFRRINAREGWHLPLIEDDDDRPLLELIESSVARVAAVSYNRSDVQDIAAERRRYAMLRENKHLSPFEMVAHPEPGRQANFTGWRQMRWYVERYATERLVERILQG